MRVALAQVAPVLLDRARTLERVERAVAEAAEAGSRLVAFGEALVPGYPVWLDRAGGARFNAPDQKELHAAYLDQAVAPDDGHLDSLKEAARAAKMAIVVGVIERASDRGGHSVFCSLVYIEPSGEIGSIHRKLVPTYEERLAWTPGDGAGLVVHDLAPFTVGALNCWENWMPLTRAALYAQGEDLHVASWPGSARNTEALTPVIAVEGRSFVMSVSALLRASDVPESFPYRDSLGLEPGELLHDGGSCLAAPDGSWVIEPQVGSEGVYVADLDHARVREERQNFDPAGHYSRPGILRLSVDRRRQRAADFIDS